MAILLPWLDEGNSFHLMTDSLAGAVPPGREIARTSLGESERAMLDYYAGIETHQLVPGGRDDFDLLLVTARPGEEDSMGSGWVKIWEGSRPGDRKACFRLYSRADKPMRKTFSSPSRKPAPYGKG